MQQNIKMYFNSKSDLKKIPLEQMLMHLRAI